jgi:hypothetical protein
MQDPVSQFGYRIQPIGNGWLWRALEASGQEVGGVASTRAEAAAFVIRALARTDLAQDESEAA